LEDICSDSLGIPVIEKFYDKFYVSLEESGEDRLNEKVAEFESL